jgi:hypothetical protein
MTASCPRISDERPTPNAELRMEIKEIASVIFFHPAFEVQRWAFDVRLTVA